MHSRARIVRFARLASPALVALATLLASLLGTLGCALPKAAPRAESTAWTAGELQPVDTRGRGTLLVRPDHQLGRYDDLLIEYVGFRYGEDQPWLSFEDEDRIHGILDGVVRGRQSGAIGLTSEPGPCVLSLRFFVTDLELLDADFNATSTVSFVRSFGEATMVMELRDSLTDEPLARYRQRRSLGGGHNNQPGTRASLHRLRRAVTAAMRDMGNELQRITPPSTTSWEDECRGGMTRVALGAH